jgi:stage II sporulation protein AB (anti-sigma F factor)
MVNYMILKFKSISENESLSRCAIASFIESLSPTLVDIADIKTSVSEAVTNAIIHGYDAKPDELVEMSAVIENDTLTVKIVDQGKGIYDIEKTRGRPMYTTRPELERSGMGFTIMESFMDSVDIISSVDSGTTIVLKKPYITRTVMTDMTKINEHYETSEELIAKIQKNDDKNAMDALIRKNSALIYSIVKKYASVKKEYSEDLYQIGTIGLIKAAKNFDFSYGTQFSTYAVHLIRANCVNFFGMTASSKSEKPARRLLQGQRRRERYIAE